MPSDPSTGDLEAVAIRFSTVQSAMVADVLDGMGYRAQTLPPNIRPLLPDMAIVGPAYTARGRATPEPVDRADVLDTALRGLTRAPAYHVLVVEANDANTYSAHVGEFHSTLLRSQGVVGTVTEGGARDARQIAALGYSVFSGYQTPQDGLPRWRMEDFQVTIQIGNVKIDPGDYVVADIDGVVIVPASLRDTVLRQADRFAKDEGKILEQVKRGQDVRDALAMSAGGPWGAAGQHEA